MTMRLAILTQFALSRKHGTGAQLLRLVEGSGIEYFHFYLTSHYTGYSEVPRSWPLNRPRWRHKAHRVALALERALDIDWWDAPNQINRSQLQRFRRKNRLECDVAYIVVPDETSAVTMKAVIDELNVPYVVHMMDIYYDDGLDPTKMPALGTLFQGATVNIALGRGIEHEIRKFGVENVINVPIGQTLTRHVARPPVAGQPLKILTVGALYRGGVSLLEQAWPELKSRLPNVQLVYAGDGAKNFPDSLRNGLDDRGYISDKGVYERLLAESHISFLSGPSQLDKYGRFSVPSRISDYLMAGLPLVATVPHETSTRHFVAPIIPIAVRATMDPGELVEAFCQFANSSETWQDASNAGRDFAERHLSIDSIRSQIFNALERAAVGHPKRS